MSENETTKSPEAIEARILALCEQARREHGWELATLKHLRKLGIVTEFDRRLIGRQALRHYRNHWKICLEGTFRVNQFTQVKWATLLGDLLSLGFKVTVGHVL